MATSDKIVVKTNADKGNTVLFRTTDTGGALQISIDGVRWFTVGGEKSSDNYMLYDFIAPLSVTPEREVHLQLAPSDNIAPGESYKVPVVGGSTGTIGFNLLPITLQRFREFLDDADRVLRSRLPEDIIYKSDGPIPDDVVPTDVARWDADTKVVSADNLPDNVVYAVDGLIPVSMLPEAALDIWEDYTNDVSM